MKRLTKTFSAILVCIMLVTPVSVVAEAVSAGEIKNKVISIAEGEVGYEGTSSYSKYGEWYGYQGGWCTTFVLWCFYKAGNALDVSLYGKIVPNGGNCNSMISWFKNKDRYHTKASGYTPKKGDLVFFDWSGNGSSQHVGLVTGTSGSTVYTVEGNCSGKVKERQYTETGSKPYNNISSIMGYGNPDYSSVADSSSATTKKKTTTKKATTTKKHTTTKKNTTTKKPSTTKRQNTTIKQTTTKRQTTTEKESTNPSTTEKTTESTTAVSTTLVHEARDMKLYAPKYDLEIGDSVKLDYQIKPKKAQAVVGYFCDEEGIIEISNGGKITAIGEGVATVVVCANDEIYRQVDFTVTTETVQVTHHTGELFFDASEEETTQAVIEKTFDKRLLEIGINVEKLRSHKDDYKYPLAIISATAVLGAITILIRRAVVKKTK